MEVIDQGFDRTVHQFHREPRPMDRVTMAHQTGAGVQNAQRTDGAPGAEKMPSFV